MNDAKARADLLAIHQAAIEAALPVHLMADHIPPRPKGRCVIIGAGKASPAMAAALDAALIEAWGEDAPVSGIVATRYGHAIPAGRIAIVEAGHPVPTPTASSPRAGSCRRLRDYRQTISSSRLSLAAGRPVWNGPSKG
jgi:glycerate-2-kinase